MQTSWATSCMYMGLITPGSPLLNLALLQLISRQTALCHHVHVLGLCVGVATASGLAGCPASLLLTCKKPRLGSRLSSRGRFAGGFDTSSASKAFSAVPGAGGDACE
eukprot:CAMPEP_0174705972 /NCGR_PEP_ID=MMETSP1094-20130205/8996_1 /TAXON_ID=156173 /ORGANISM="Chrysochromulina brevifilum, Strain UTEX LB 985" /LENGTH=106 /DNA_ID=CAMNT_0015904195 /DNA_START=90 /DNA_END=412 /DNA_ORIENTATION=+